jgi:alanine racemase
MGCRSFRPAWVEIDLDAIAHNVSLLAGLVAPSRLCAVVKADAYGHGAVAVARAALRAGASLLAVALVEEGVALRDAGIDAPVLLLSEPTKEAIAEAIARRLTLTLYTEEGVAAAAQAAARRGEPAEPVPVHLKVDTGMHRVGAAPESLAGLAAALDAAPQLRLVGLWTHLAVADEPEDPFTALQLGRLHAARRALDGLGLAPRLLHAANTAAAIAFPKSRLDLVRCGIGCYGYAPSAACEALLEGALPAGEGLRPVLSLKARVHLVRELDAGERTSYGRTYALPRRAQVAVLPLGYHDGVARALACAGAEVLIGGRRRRLAGTVTMDQLLIDCGEGPPVAPGDEAVLLGRQGDEQVSAQEWAQLLGTISYEVLCGIGPRVPRITVEVGDAARR